MIAWISSYVIIALWVIVFLKKRAAVILDIIYACLCIVMFLNVSWCVASFLGLL